MAEKFSDHVMMFSGRSVSVCDSPVNTDEKQVKFEVFMQFKEKHDLSSLRMT